MTKEVYASSLLLLFVLCLTVSPNQTLLASDMDNNIALAGNYVLQDLNRNRSQYYKADQRTSSNGFESASRTRTPVEPSTTHVSPKPSKQTKVATTTQMTTIDNNSGGTKNTLGNSAQPIVSVDFQAQNTANKPTGINTNFEMERRNIRSKPTEVAAWNILAIVVLLVSLIARRENADTSSPNHQTEKTTADNSNNARKENRPNSHKPRAPIAAANA